MAFSFGQTKAEVEETLKGNNYRYKDNDDRDGFIGSQVVEYMGVKWDGFMLSFKDGMLEQITFRKADGESLTEEDAEKKLLSKLMNVLANIERTEPPRENMEQLDGSGRKEIFMRASRECSVEQ